MILRFNLREDNETIATSREVSKLWRWKRHDTQVSPKTPILVQKQIDLRLAT